MGGCGADKESLENRYREVCVENIELRKRLAALGYSDWAARPTPQARERDSKKKLEEEIDGK